MLSSAENLAIHLTLAFAFTPEQAAKVTGADPRKFGEAANKCLPHIRGRKVPYDRFLSDGPGGEYDGFRLDKEVQLAQLQHLHDECLRSWAVSSEHASRLAAFERQNPAPDGAPPKKAHVGDIRFLQLAKSLRAEMAKIEKAIAQHIEEKGEAAAANPQPAPSQPSPSQPAPPPSQPETSVRAEVQTDSPVTTTPPANSAPALDTAKPTSPPSTPPSKIQPKNTLPHMHFTPAPRSKAG